MPAATLTPDAREHAAAFWALSSDLFAVVAADGTFLSVNAAWERTLGWAPDDVLGRRVSDLLHPCDVDAAVAILRDTPPGERIDGFENRYRCRDGSYRRLLWTADTDGEVWWAVAKDVTDRRTAQDQLSRAHQVAGLVSWEWDLRTGQLRASEGFAQMTGMDVTDDLQMADVLALMPAGDRERIQRAVWRLLTTDDDTFAVDFSIRAEGIPTVWLHARGLLERDEQGEPAVVLGTSQDVTASRAASEEIRIQAQLLDAVDAAVIATDLEGRITHFNRGAERMYGCSAGEVLGRQALEVTVAPEDAATAAAAHAALTTVGTWEGEFLAQRGDGSTFPAYVRDSLIPDGDGGWRGAIGVSVDLSERLAAEAQLRRVSDHLRAVNDAMGEGVYTLDAGGRLRYMNQAAERMLGWTAAELEGRLMHEVTHRGGTAACAAQRTCATGETVRVEDDAFTRRDGTMLPVSYTASAFGAGDVDRGVVVVFSDITARKAEQVRLRAELDELTWVTRIREALAEDRFELHAQPIVDVHTGATVQHELLIRMRRPDGGLVLPGRFLPAAERFGLMPEIDRWVIGRAAEMAGRGQPVELNLSAASLSRLDLLDALEEDLAAAGADPSDIVIEITETAIVADEDVAAAFVRRAAALGCRIALDDFGTGYGGFVYLKHLPVDSLKIDREFVRDLWTDEASQHVVKAVVSLARGFGQKTVAEGVEDQATLELLRDMGVDLAQGYLFARPFPVADLQV